MPRHGRGTVTLGGVVAAGEVGHTAFAGVVGLWLGNFTGDKEIGSSGNGRLEVGLRTTGAQGHAPHRPHGIAHQSGGATERVLCPLGESRRGGGFAMAEKAERLLAETATRGTAHVHAQPLRQLGVVAQFGVGIQRQVVGEEVDVVRQQARQTLLHPAGHTAILSAPEQAVVHEDSVGTGRHGGVDEGKAGGHAGDDLAHRRFALDLQAIGAVVTEECRLQQGVESGEQLLAGDWSGVCVHGPASSDSKTKPPHRAAGAAIVHADNAPRGAPTRGAVDALRNSRGQTLPSCGRRTGRTRRP